MGGGGKDKAGMPIDKGECVFSGIRKCQLAESVLGFHTGCVNDNWFMFAPPHPSIPHSPHFACSLTSSHYSVRNSLARWIYCFFRLLPCRTAGVCAVAGLNFGPKFYMPGLVGIPRTPDGCTRCTCGATGGFLNCAPLAGCNKAHPVSLFTSILANRPRRFIAPHLQVR